ncbi:low-density lipoprotein receptor domain class A domain-containing protein [Ditylenchus destructor]|uniref:Low-density lipoprotein receptor domain class A domain-containing protein n=1 Tax=Ditylenchus destructor TaxID=166010 RepID=A0AAD4MY17_9BILA|nr:low-density lipoprotein receptor domain class A domain-containing protein [Ditylenchus destructor]
MSMDLTETTVRFYCAARGKKVEVFFTRAIYDNYDRHLGNATEEDMTRSEIEQIFDKEFVNSSKCISAKRLTVPFVNAENAGLYHCYAGKRYDGIFVLSVQQKFKLKLERSGGMCHMGSEWACANGRQCISINQTCDQKSDCEDESDEKFPKERSITDEYGFDGNNSVHFYCAARGKDIQVFFSRRGHNAKERLLGNATEEDMTFSEIKQISGKSFMNSSKCITAKRLTIPFTNAESAGAYTCYAKNSYDVTSATMRLKLERSGGTCHSESEWSCADERQCIAKSQLCDGRRTRQRSIDIMNRTDLTYSSRVQCRVSNLQTRMIHSFDRVETALDKALICPL